MWSHNNNPRALSPRFPRDSLGYYNGILPGEGSSQQTVRACSAYLRRLVLQQPSTNLADWKGIDSEYAPRLTEPAMDDNLQFLANVSQIASLVVAVIALILQVITLIKPRILPILGKIRPILPFIFIAALFFFVGSQTTHYNTDIDNQLRATNIALQSTVNALSSQQPAPVAITQITPITQVIPVTQMTEVTKVIEVTKEVEVTKVIEVTPTSAPPTSTPNPAILFEDDFTTGIKPEWNMKGSSFTTVDGTLSSQGLLEGYIGDASWVNYAVEFDLLSAYSSPYGLKIQIRRKDSSNYMSWEFFQGNDVDCGFVWTKTISGKETQIVNTQRGSSCGRQFRLEVSGNTYRTIVDGKQLISITDDTFTNGGVGLTSNGNDLRLTLDNFKVTKLP